MLHQAAQQLPDSLPIQDEAILLFPDGLVGCPNWRRFALTFGSVGNPVSRLQCLNEPDVCFIVTDPRNVEPRYSAAVPEDYLLDLGLDSSDEGLMLCTLAVRGEPAVVTANLLAPLIINPRFRVGKQVVLVESGYSARHPIVTSLRRPSIHPASEGD